MLKLGIFVTSSTLFWLGLSNVGLGLYINQKSSIHAHEASCQQDFVIMCKALAGHITIHGGAHTSCFSHSDISMGYGCVKPYVIPSEYHDFLPSKGRGQRAWTGEHPLLMAHSMMLA